MDDRIQIVNGKEDGYTAKEAMEHFVRYMKTKTAHAVEIITVGGAKDDGAESVLFVKMCMRFLHKNAKKVFLLAQNEGLLQELREHMEETYPRIHVVEMANWEEHAMSHDMILNHINGAAVECVIAALSYEEQDSIFEKYRTALDAKIWIGLGTDLKRNKKKNILGRIGDFLNRQFAGKKS